MTLFWIGIAVGIAGLVFVLMLMLTIGEVVGQVCEHSRRYHKTRMQCEDLEDTVKELKEKLRKMEAANIQLVGEIEAYKARGS